MIRCSILQKTKLTTQQNKHNEAPALAEGIGAFLCLLEVLFEQVLEKSGLLTGFFKRKSRAVRPVIYQGNTFETEKSEEVPMLLGFDKAWRI